MMQLADDLPGPLPIGQSENEKWLAQQENLLVPDNRTTFFELCLNLSHIHAVIRLFVSFWSPLKTYNPLLC